MRRRVRLPAEHLLELRAHELHGVADAVLARAVAAVLARVDDLGRLRGRGEVGVGGVNDDEARGLVVGADAGRARRGFDAIQDHVADADEVDRGVRVVAPAVLRVLDHHPPQAGEVVARRPEVRDVDEQAGGAEEVNRRARRLVVVGQAGNPHPPAFVEEDVAQHDLAARRVVGRRGGVADVDPRQRRAVARLAVQIRALAVVGEDRVRDGDSRPLDVLDYGAVDAAVGAAPEELGLLD